MLPKSLIDKEFSTESCVAWNIFSKDDNSDQERAKKALCALLHQLFAQKTILLKHAIPDFASDGAKFPHLFQNLWYILVKATADTEAGKIVCVLDASSRAQNTKLLFLLTSRLCFEFEQHFRELTSPFPNIRLAGENETGSISQETNTAIKAKVKKLGTDLLLDSHILIVWRESSQE